MTEIKTLSRAAERMNDRHPDWTLDQCDVIVREVIAVLGTDLVLRCLYDSVVAELQRMRQAA